MACSTSCPTQDCESYGACLRRKGIQIDTYSLQFGAVELEKRKDHTLARFKACVEAGLTPAAPLRTDVAKAEAILNKNRSTDGRPALQANDYSDG